MLNTLCLAIVWAAPVAALAAMLAACLATSHASQAYRLAVACGCMAVAAAAGALLVAGNPYAPAALGNGLLAFGAGCAFAYCLAVWRWRIAANAPRALGLHYARHAQSPLG